MLSNKTLRRILVSLLLLCFSSTIMFAAGQSEDKKPQVLKIANYFAPDHPVNKNLEDIFKKTVESETDLVVEIYPSNQLGGESEFSEGVMIGNIEMAVTGNIWELYNEDIAFTQLPYVFVSVDHANAIMNGEVGKKVYSELFSPIGIKVLGYFSQGGRALSNNVRPIDSPADAEGIKMRTWQGTTIIEIMERFGFDVTVMGMDELFTALQQGVVNAQDNPVSATYHNGWFEVLDYVSLTNHIISPNYFVINEKAFEGLTDQQRSVIEKAAKQAIAKTQADIVADEESIVKLIQDEMGVQVSYCDIKPFMEKVLPMINEYKEKHPAVSGIIDEIQDTGKDFL